MKINEKFFAITKDKALAMYQEGYLTAAGYLVTIKGILVPDSVDLKIPSISGFCQEWGLPRSSFYRGISKLEKNGHGRLEPTGESVFSCQGLKPKSDKVKCKIEPKKEASFPKSDCLGSGNECPTSETDCLTFETVAPENPHCERVSEPLKEREILEEDNITYLSLDPERAREKKLEGAIEIFSEEVCTQEGSLDKPYLSDPEYLHFKAVYDKAALVIKNPIVLSKMRVQYLGRWEGNEQTHTSPSEQANMVALEPDREIKGVVTQPVTLAKKINPIVDDIPTVGINSQLATKKVDPFFPAKNTISYRRELAKNARTIFPSPEEEDEFFEQYRHYLQATNSKLLPGQIEAIAKASLKRINQSAADASDRAVLKMWESGELKNFIGATYDAMASRVADARDRIDRALNNNRGQQYAF
jgi:hypothetical protein